MEILLDSSSTNVNQYTHITPTSPLLYIYISLPNKKREELEADGKSKEAIKPES